MKSRLFIPAVIVLALLVAACTGEPPELRNEQLLHDDGFITGSPCELPCWRGIVPGETTWDDAMTILEEDSDLAEIQVEEADDSDAMSASWQQVDGIPCCQMFSETGDIVDSMLLMVAPDIRVSEVIETYGEPEYVIESGFSTDQAILNLFYPEVPMVVYAFIPGEDGSLEPSSEIIGFILFKEADIDLLISGNDFRAWQGYQSFKAYQESDLIVTAAPQDETESDQEQ